MRPFSLLGSRNGLPSYHSASVTCTPLFRKAAQPPDFRRHAHAFPPPRQVAQRSTPLRPQPVFALQVSLISPPAARRGDLGVCILDPAQGLPAPRSGRRRFVCAIPWSPPLYRGRWLLQEVLQTTRACTPRLCFPKGPGAGQRPRTCPHGTSRLRLQSAAGLRKR